MNAPENESALPRWDLTTLYPALDSPSRKEDMDRLRKLARSFQEKYRGHVSSLTGAELLEAFQKEGEIHGLSAKLGVHAFLSFTENTQDALRQAALSEVEELGASIGQDLVFFDLELGQADSSAWLADPSLGEYHYYIRRSVERANHNLSEELEAFSIEKNLTGKNALISIFDEFFGQFSFEEETPEGKKRFTEETALAVLHSPDRKFRTQIYSRFLEEVGKNKGLLSNIYNNLILDHRLSSKRRKFEELMDSRNLSNQVSSKTVRAMLDTVEAGYPIAQRYFRTKARLLGLRDFTNADIYAPMTTEDRKIPFPEAKEMVLESYRKYDATLGAMVEDFFRDRRVDAALSEGKRGGAFCYGASPDLDAYVMLNYTGDIRSVQTLAHELGHGVHHQLAKRQNYTSFDTPLTTAETASVFGEILLNERLYETSSAPGEKLAVMASQMEGIIATVFRQTVLTRFEEAAHGEREKGRVAPERFCELWWNENKKLYGDAVQMVESYRWGWAYIPHFYHTPFYCYAYSFGQLLVLALYNEYRKRGDAFREGYRELLASGGSARPSELVQRTVGLDIEDPGFWAGALSILEEMAGRIETLADKVGESA